MLKRAIPNTITLANLSCGVLGILYAFADQLIISSILICAALVFDFFDGFSARMLKVSSPLGKELDSLADLVTFGVLPGVIIFALLKASIPENPLSLYAIELFNQTIPLIYFIPAVLIPVLSALRLAKFNIDESQSDSFSGLPTPANAIFIASYPLIEKYGPEKVKPFIITPYFLIISSVILALLLVTPVRLMALKFKSFGLKENSFKYLLILGIIILAVTLGIVAIPTIIAYYILLSITENILTTKNNKV